MAIPSTICGRWEEISERVAKACKKAGRASDSVQVVAVSKTFSAEQVLEAYEAGARIFGENYVQEALPKLSAIRDSGKAPLAEWHFIGSLQSNKAKQVVGAFSMIHSVDRNSLVKELQKSAEKANQTLRVLVEVNVGEEASKSGVSTAGLRPLCEAISASSRLHLEGLMAFPPPVDDPEEARPFFAQTRALAEQARAWKLPNTSFDQLSMGISGDFEVAIEEGATFVRIGTALFGTRG